LIPNKELTVSVFKLNIYDIANGYGFCIATLKNGIQLKGKVNKKLSDDVLHLNTAKGWHSIDWEEIVAITGEQDEIN
jgi:hypothetical protein